MTVAFATPDQLAGFLSSDQEPLADASRLLARATEVVDYHILAPFDIDADTQLPTNTAIAGALADATCAQVEFWLEVSEEHDIDGLHGTNVTVTGYSGKRAPQLAPRARRILAEAGMFRTYTTEQIWPLAGIVT